MEFVKKNIDLVAAAAIPIIMIIFIAASIYLPRFLLNQLLILFISVPMTGIIRIIILCKMEK